MIFFFLLITQKISEFNFAIVFIAISQTNLQSMYGHAPGDCIFIVFHTLG